jgi:hypothetical protein
VTDKRKSPRIHSLNFVAEEGLMLRTLDVSHDGMLLEMVSPPPLGTRLTLKVALGEDVLDLPAQVVRHELLPENRVGVGVRFSNVPAAARRVLDEHLSELAER